MRPHLLFLAFFCLTVTLFQSLFVVVYYVEYQLALYCIELFVFMIEVKLLYLRSLLLYVIQKRYFYPDFPIGPSRVLIYLVYSGNFVGNFMSTVTACLVSTLKSSAEIYLNVKIIRLLSRLLYLANELVTGCPCMSI